LTVLPPWCVPHSVYNLPVREQAMAWVAGHTYATKMLRAGVSLPALMKLPGHTAANMTLRYVEITQTASAY